MPDYYFFNFFKVYSENNYSERETVQAGEEREKEGDTESKEAPRLWTVSTEPDVGLELTNREIMTWAEVERSTGWATQAPLKTPDYF